MSIMDNRAVEAIGDIMDILIDFDPEDRLGILEDVAARLDIRLENLRDSEDET